MNFRRIIAAAAITGALAALPITMIATNGLAAGGVATKSTTVTVQGGQGGWPFKV
jgi:hypothetical protein